MKHKHKTKCTHTPCPEGYMSWQDWAAKMNKTHKQIRCPGCFLFKLWIPRAMTTKQLGIANSSRAEARERRKRAKRHKQTKDMFTGD